MLALENIQSTAFECANQFVESVDIQQMGCLVLDTQLNDMQGIELHQWLLRQSSPISIVYYTHDANIQLAIQALKLGAVDFLIKPICSTKIYHAIQMGWSQSIRNHRHLHIQNQFHRLTPREKEVLSEVLQGKINSTIASHLNVSRRTIEVHRANIMRKFDASNLVDLILKMSHLDNLNSISHSQTKPSAHSCEVS